MQYWNQASDTTNTNFEFFPSHPKFTTEWNGNRKYFFQIKFDSFQGILWFGCDGGENLEMTKLCQNVLDVAKANDCEKDGFTFFASVSKHSFVEIVECTKL